MSITTTYDIEAERPGESFVRGTVKLVVEVHQRPEGGYSAKHETLGNATGPTWLAAVRELLRKHSYQMRVAAPRGSTWRLT